MSAKILLVYYSQTGRTARIAQLIARAADCDIERIEAVIPFTGDRECTQKRLDEDPFPAINRLTRDIRQYGTVILGMPVWNNGIPGPMITFIDMTDWRGITVHPFFTSGGIFINIYGMLKDKCKGASVKAPLYLIYDGSGNLTDIRE